MAKRSPGAVEYRELRQTWRSTKKRSYREDTNLSKMVCRLEQPSPQWCFTLMPVDELTTKSMVFSCQSDAIRKEWMKQLKDSMTGAHRILQQEMVPTDEYVYIEKPLNIPETARCQTLPAVNDTSNETQSGDEEDYSTIDEAAIHNINQSSKNRPKKPNFKPAAPTHTPLQYAVPDKKDDKSSKKAKAKIPTPQTSSVAKQERGRLGSDYDYDGTDRTEVERILTQRPEGTFLVRKSRMEDKRVLSVNVGGALKEFKIFNKEEGKITLDNVDYFMSLDELIANYKKKNLPKKTTSLYRPYSVTDTGYINK